MKDLKGKRVAILATNGFEQSELFEPMKAFQDSGAEVLIISTESGEIKAWNENNWGKSIKVDLTIDKAKVNDFDALFLPGGVINPDKLRRDERAVSFVKDFFKSNKFVAAICHGPQLLIEADLVRGKKLTSFPSVKTDLKNAGADWVDEEVVFDHNLLTSRSPRDIKAFNQKFIDVLARVEEMAR